MGRKSPRVIGIAHIEGKTLVLTPGLPQGDKPGDAVGAGLP